MPEFHNSSNPGGGEPGSPKAQPHTKESPKELREGETEFLTDFHSLADLSTKLERYQDAEELKSLTNHFRELYKAMRPRPPEARTRIPDSIDSIAPNILDRTDLLVRQFLASDTLQNLFKQTLGQEIHSLDEARELRETLLSPITQRFKTELPVHRDFWNLAPSNPERKAEISRAIRTVTTDNPDWPATVAKLKLLPGSHQPLLTECLTSEAEECWQRLLEYGNPPPSKRKGQLDLEPSEKVLFDLYQTLTDASYLTHTIESKHPFLPSPESLPSKPERKSGKPSAITELIERTADNREVKLNLSEILTSSRVFLESHNLADLAVAVPQEIKFSEASLARVREAMREGFDRALVLPPPEVQSTVIDTLLTELATKPVEGLSDEDQYTTPYLYQPEVLKQATPRNRPTGKPYLLLYRSSPIPQETKNKTFPELDTLFATNRWNGLTLPEHLLLQRKEAEARRNHSFDAWSNDPTQSQWSWLLDSRVPSGVVRAGWDPGGRRVVVRWGDSGGRLPRLGARPAVVVELEL